MKKKIIVGVLILLTLIVGVVVFFVIKNFYGEQKQGECLVLDNRYCKLLKSEGNDNSFRLNAKLPIGTKIFSPTDGNCSDQIRIFKSETEKIFGVKLEVKEENSTKSIRYFLWFQQGKCINESIKKGDLIGEITKDSKSGDANNNFVVTISSWKEDDFLYNTKNNLEKDLMNSLLIKK